MQRGYRAPGVPRVLWINDTMMQGCAMVRIVLAFTVSLTMLAAVAGCDNEPQTLGGPVALFEGPVPTHGFLCLAFDTQAAQPLTITSITPGTPAAESPLAVGDVVVSLDGVAVANLDELRKLLKETKPGQSVALGYVHHGEQASTQVMLVSVEAMIMASEEHRRATSSP